MSLHRLSACAGYQYLLRHTACGDVERDASTPLTAYYTNAGYPPGRWFGSGLAGVGAGAGLPAGSVVGEEQMAALYGAGRDPVTGHPLGRAYPTYKGSEPGRASRGAVAGFDLTFTVPKSASVLWALGDPRTQDAVLRAHRAAVDEALALVERRALFTRVGAQSCAQVPTRGMIAAVFDHWDTRTSDPNLHSHVVIANKVQGLDGRWRSVDSRALHHAVVAVSEVYDNLFADQLARELPVSWSWRDRGARRTPAFELDGIGDEALSEFSTRSTHIDQALRTAIADFHDTYGRGPNRVETLRLRQQATRATRPGKQAQPLAHLLASWRHRAATHLGRTHEQVANAALSNDCGEGPRRLRAADISEAQLQRMAQATVDRVVTRRSTWTRWNLLAEAARTTRGIRMATPTDRNELHDRVVDASLNACVALHPPDLFTVPGHFRRADGTSVFRRPDEEPFTNVSVLGAEQRLLDAHADVSAPTASQETAHRIATTPQPSEQGVTPVKLAPDQVDAVVTIATSGRRLDVLVGPAGTGKTTTLRAVRAAWETTHGRGSVLGLAPSATAAKELAQALRIPCENVAKWRHETTGPGGQQRQSLIDELQTRKTLAIQRRDVSAARSIDGTMTRLGREHARWTLRPGQLIVVDEASLAGTFDLEDLSAQASAAGAKLLLVGDHHQLSAVDAGGAFGLLADAGHSSQLRSLWRFRQRWEAGATRLLRDGDPAAIAWYQANGRINEGGSEAMLEAAYRGWQASASSGCSAILVAVDTHSVDALNARAHEDRVLDGSVAGDGVPIADGAVAGVGDRILTRQNQRSIRTPDGGHVRNGALWVVTATHAHGSLTVTPTSWRNATPATGEEPGRPVTLPADYVREHVELGYATTVHRAQGLTVDHAHVLAAPGMTREALYVAMSRGRAANQLYVSTDAIDPDCDELPDPGRTNDATGVLRKILATASVEQSATQTLRTRQDEAESLAMLLPIRATLLADADTRRWSRLLPDCHLTRGQVQGVLASPAAGALFAALRDGEHHGFAMDRVLTLLVDRRPLDSPDDAADDVAAVLHERVTAWLDTEALTEVQGPIRCPQAYATQPQDPPSRLDPDDPVAHSPSELDDLIRARVESDTLAAGMERAEQQPRPTARAARRLTNDERAPSR